MAEDLREAVKASIKSEKPPNFGGMLVVDFFEVMLRGLIRVLRRLISRGI